MGLKFHDISSLVRGEVKPNIFEEMEAVARQNGITQMELEVVEGNERAMALYEKQGFAVTGTIPGAIRYKDGRERCYYYMVKKL